MIHGAIFTCLIISLLFTCALIYEYKNSIVIGDDHQKQEVLNKIETEDRSVINRIAHSYVSDLYGYQDQTIHLWLVCVTYGVLNISLMAFCLKKLKAIESQSNNE
jgi:hypothetical protein